MKTTKKLFLVLVVAFTSVLSVSAASIKEEPTLLAKEIAMLLDKPEFVVGEDLVAKISFVFNKENEIVVLSVETESSELERYIKKRLNYTKLSLTLEKEKTYKLAIRVTAD